MSPNDRDPSGASGVASLEPVDADIALITDYLSNELPPHTVAAVKRRLVDDAAFFEKVAPLLGLALLRNRARRATTIPEARRPAAAPRRWRRWVDVAEEKQGLRRIAALVLFCLALGGTGTVVNVEHATYAAVGFARMTTVPPRARVYETARTETRAFTLDDGSRILLRPYSRFTTTPRTSGVRGTIATLRGEALIDVARSTYPIFLGTAAGGAVLLKGTFGVRCEQGCFDMKVNVGTGHGWALGSTGTGFVYLWPGTQARVPEGDVAERVHGYQYPRVTP